jgi:predicted site-specific integrase-resolvase
MIIVTKKSFLCTVVRMCWPNHLMNSVIVTIRPSWPMYTAVDSLSVRTQHSKRPILIPGTSSIGSSVRKSGVHQDLIQIHALEVYCNQHEIRVDAWMQDTGSGLNYQRTQFNRLMEMVELGQVRRIVIAHRDRLVRFGFSYFEAFCERHNTDIVVTNGEELSPEQELVQDLLAVVTVFGARLHGLRSYKKVIRDAALQKNQT